MSRFDTGDHVCHRATGERHIVACVHEPYFYTAGNPAYKLLEAACDLVRKATPAERDHDLARMAAVAGTGHRPRCARERLRIAAGQSA